MLKNISFGCQFKLCCFSNEQNLVTLSPHPNIVVMHMCFADYVPELTDSHSLYPQALPPRINPEGYGRNMSLFLVMKK